jgi:hypothetical protein
VGSEEDAPVSSEEEKNMALVRRFWEAQANADILGANPQGGLVDQLPGRSLKVLEEGLRSRCNLLGSYHGRLAVEDYRDGRLFSNADGRIAGAGVNDDHFIGSLILALHP